MRGEGPIADLLAQRFAAAKRRLGLDPPRQPLDVSQFRVPAKTGDQIDLFG
jgi:hypothetical protein